MTDVFELTRSIVGIESTTDNEMQVASFLFDYLSRLAARTGGSVERMDVPERRCNLFAWWGKPVVTLSTHMDAVPPFIPWREDAEFIWGRGACDAKGILASMIVAAEKLIEEGRKNFGLLFLVGEERNSAGAIVAARMPRGSRFLVLGEPTENKLALWSKGSLRLEITTRGMVAHSAYPELGQSAIDTLLDVLDSIRRISLPQDPVLGASTMNIGTITGGRAPNIVADTARAEILVRLVGDAACVRESFAAAIANRASLKEVLCIPAVQFERLDGIPTMVVSYTTDGPILAPAWGKPFLIGPGSIHVAHTEEERVSKSQLLSAVEIYSDMVRRLLVAGEKGLCYSGGVT
jgi:acetylornithine deacetylase